MALHDSQSTQDDQYLNRKAIHLLQDGVFGKDWRFVPTKGKETFVKSWTDKALLQEACIQTYRSHSYYAGIGVVTGKQSGGLLTLDVDGPEADLRYKEVSGDQYEIPGQESTMVTTSGRPGRRQIFYMVPSSLIRSLDDFTKLALRSNGEWQATKGDGNNSKEEQKDKFQELVLRFNGCMSVLPGSVHPTTGKWYKFAHYNNGIVAPAPQWVMELILPLRESVSFFSNEEMLQIQEDLHLDHRNTHYPENMIRGWFFKNEVQKLLQPRLEDLIFKHEDLDGNWKDKGDGVHRQNFCPWHGGESGTSFQYNQETGNWYCFACGSGGDVVDFKWRLETHDIYSDRPHGRDLEVIVEEISDGLGLDYIAECAPTQKMEVTERPKLSLSTDDFFLELKKIQENERNPAKRLHKMGQLAAETGSRMTGSQCQSALDSSLYYENASRLNEDRTYKWWENVSLKTPVIPNLLEAPQQTILAAEAGAGKTATCMALAVAVGRGHKFTVRGIDIKLARGPVLWIQNDQPLPKLLADMADADITPENDCDGPDAWFHVRRNWQIDHTWELQEWISEIKPALVIIDSIGSCSTNSAVEEKDKAFASPLYQFSQRNGDPDGGFPATSIIWIHHLNKQGGVRGTAYLEAAVDEVWTLTMPTEAQAETLRGQRKSPNRCRVIKVGKSRMGRSGDCLITERGADYEYTVWDWTPTEVREANVGEGVGDLDLESVALKIVRDMKEVSAQVVFDEIVLRCNGLVMDAPSSRTVRRWLDRWVERGLLKLLKTKSQTGQGKKIQVYSLNDSLSRARARGISKSHLSLADGDPLQEKGLAIDTETVGKNVSLARPTLQQIIDDRCSDHEWVALCTHPKTGEQLTLAQNGTGCHFLIPSLAGLFTQEVTKDIGISTTCARVRKHGVTQSPDQDLDNTQPASVNSGHGKSNPSSRIDRGSDLLANLRDSTGVDQILDEGAEGKDRGGQVGFVREDFQGQEDCGQGNQSQSQQAHGGDCEASLSQEVIVTEDDDYSGF